MIGFYLLLIGIVSYVIGYALGVNYINKAKDKEELNDPTVHVLERRLYWLSNINSAYNQIQQIFDNNPDKFKCLKLVYENKCYNYNRFYCRYRSIGNKYIIKMTINSESTPVLTIEENKETP